MTADDVQNVRQKNLANKHAYLVIVNTCWYANKRDIHFWAGQCYGTDMRKTPGSCLDRIIDYNDWDV
jgi:hypothetical protein